MVTIRTYLIKAVRAPRDLWTVMEMYGTVVGSFQRTASKLTDLEDKLESSEDPTQRRLAADVRDIRRETMKLQARAKEVFIHMDLA